MNEKNNNSTSPVKPDSSSGIVRAGNKKGISKLLAGFAAVLGISKSEPHKPRVDTSDTGTLLAQERTDLAMDRTHWAAQRTLMGWIRTALSMISFGFTIGKLGQTMEEVQVTGLAGTRMIGIDTIAYFLVVIGTMALLGAAIQYNIRVRDLRKQGLQKQISIEFLVALVISLMGMVAFTALVMKV
jgi:putative membrane protein